MKRSGATHSSDPPASPAAGGFSPYSVAESHCGVSLHPQYLPSITHILASPFNVAGEPTNLASPHGHTGFSSYGVHSQAHEQLPECSYGKSELGLHQPRSFEYPRNYVDGYPFDWPPSPESSTQSCVSFPGNFSHSDESPTASRSIRSC